MHLSTFSNIKITVESLYSLITMRTYFDIYQKI